MVPLQVDRPGTCHIGPQRAAGAPSHGLIINDLFAVQDDRDVAVNKGDVQGLPFPGGLLGGDRGFDAAVDGPHVVRVGRLAVSVGHLNLVDASDIDPAVPALGQAGFDVRLKSSKSRSVRRLP